DGLQRDAGLVRRAGAGRDDHAVIAADEQLVDGGPIVAYHLDLTAELAHVLDEVVGEAVVVVDDEDPHSGQPYLSGGYGHSGWATASAMASSTARDLASDS